MTAETVQLLVSIAGIIVAALSAALTYYFTKKKQLLADETRLKEKAYLNFIEAVNGMLMSEDLEKSRDIYSESHNKILLIGSPEVVRTLREFTIYVNIDRKEGFSDLKHDQLLTALVKSMRLDMYKNKKINLDYPIISLLGKNGRR